MTLCVPVHCATSTLVVPARLSMLTVIPIALIDCNFDWSLLEISEMKTERRQNLRPFWRVLRLSFNWIYYWTDLLKNSWPRAQKLLTNHTFDSELEPMIAR